MSGHREEERRGGRWAPTNSVRNLTDKKFLDLDLQYYSYRQLEGEEEEHKEFFSLVVLAATPGCYKPVEL